MLFLKTKLVFVGINKQNNFVGINKQNNLPIGYMLRLYVCVIFIKSALVIPSRKFGDSVTTIKLPECPTRGSSVVETVYIT